jgi:ubiquinol-cytochrome c reductase cytochrome c1 subunit
MLTNKKIKLAAVAVALLSTGSLAQAAGGGDYLSADNDVANQASLQRGARNFVNYCMGCHSAEYVRYNRVGTDLGLSDQQVIDNLMFTGVRPSDTMQIAMRPDDAARWFGV